MILMTVEIKNLLAGEKRISVQTRNNIIISYS